MPKRQHGNKLAIKASLRLIRSCNKVAVAAKLTNRMQVTVDDNDLQAFYALNRTVQNAFGKFYKNI